MIERLLTSKEAADFLRMGTSTLAKLRLHGGGPIYTKLGKCVRYSTDDLRTWILQKRRTSTAAVYSVPERKLESQQ